MVLNVKYVNNQGGERVFDPLPSPSGIVHCLTGTVPEFVDILSDLGHVVLSDAELLGLLLLRHYVPGKQSQGYLFSTVPEHL